MAGFYDVGKLVATLGLNTSPFMAGADAANNKMRQMQNSFMMTGRAMTRFVTIPMALAGGAAVNAQKDFENSMTKIIGLVGIARDEVEGWKDEIFAISRETGRGPRELGDALYFVTSAGFRGSEALDILHKSAMAAAGGMGDTKDIADLVTSAMYAYRKSNLSATEAMDAVIASVREGKVEVTDLINSMGKVFPIASKFGVSINEVGAAFAAMTRSGTEADKASTHLRAILNQMMSPSEQVKKNLAGLAMGAEEFQDILMNDGLIVALQALNTAIKGDPRAYANIFQNIRALTGVLDLMGDNMEENIRIFERMKNANGELKKLFEEVQETTQFKLDKALANLGITLIELGEILKDPVVKMLEKLTGWIQKVSDWLNTMSTAQKEATLKLVGFVAVLGPALVLISRLSMMLAAMTGNIPALVAMLGVAGFAWGKYKKAIKDVSAETRVSDSVRKHATQRMIFEKDKLEDLYRIAKDETKSKEDRIHALKEMEGLYPKYFSNLDMEKIKVSSIMDAYAEWEQGTQLKANMEGIVTEMRNQRAKVEKINSLAYGDAQTAAKELFTLGERLRIRQDVQNRNTEESVRASLEGRKVEYITYSQYVGEVVTALYEKEKAALVGLAAQLDDASEAWNQWNRIRLLAAEEEDTGDPEKVARTARATGGYMYDLQQRIKKAQEEILSASYMDLAAKNDKLRLLQREAFLAQGLSENYGYMGELQHRMAVAQSFLPELSGEQLVKAQEIIAEYQEQIDLIDLAVNGLGEIEIVQYRISQIQKDIVNASSDQRENLQIILGLYRDQLHELTKIDNEVDPFKMHGTAYDAGKDAKEYTVAWKAAYQDRLKWLKGFMEAEAFYNGTQTDKYKAWADEKKEIERNFLDWRLSAVNETYQVLQQFASAMQQFYYMQMQKELAMYENNKQMQEKIEQKYLRKQKAWAIAQAIMNMAVAVTKVLSQLGILGAPAAAAIGVTGAVQVGIAKATSFKEGGLVYGETLAQVGDYPGARANPEVIAPLSDLKKMLKDDRTSSGAPKYIKLVAEGPDLVASLDLQQLLNNTY